jgi:NAD(P)-dependent dehydrogenase (short-subunit alcohol dehydrogenase family)
VSRVAVISGAGGGGIGTEIVRRFLENGYVVYTIEATSKAAQRITAVFPKLKSQVIVGDVGNIESSLRLLKVMKQRGHTCSILVHNAARGEPFVDIEKVTMANLQTDLSDILFGAFNLVNTFAPSLKKVRDGRVVLISSSAAIRGSWGRSLTYAAAKAALHGLSKQVALQLAEFGVTSNVVIPFQTLTPRVIRGGRRSRRSIYSTAKQIVPLGRPALPSDIAALVDFLASREASYLTGQEIYLDGGQTLAPKIGVPRETKL